MGVQQNIRSILNELAQNAQSIDNAQAGQLIAHIRKAGHIFLQGAGRSGIAIRGFANRLCTLVFPSAWWGKCLRRTVNRGIY